MNRRHVLLAGAAVAAGAAGAGLAWWRKSQDDHAAAAVWALRFETPAGGPLALAPYRGRPVLLNFWATWCAPCIKEMPLLDRFDADHRSQGWAVIGLAVDNLEPVREFLVKRPVGFAIGLAGIEGVELSRSLGNRDGALPFSVVLNRAGGIVERKLGAVQPAELARWAGAAG